jgi:hypothetical protein
MAKLVKWVKCPREKCPEGYTGQCTRGHFDPDLREDFPADGMCLYPDYMEYDKEVDEMGVYEDGEKVAEVVV